MNTLLLHPITKSRIESILKSTPPNLLITGLPGAGKYSVAMYLAMGSGSISESSNIISFSEKPITIDNVREIIRFAKLKASYKRYVIIEHAETMTNEAQNALLKIMEEPPENFYILATSTHKEYILPTVLSRMSELPILTPQVSQVVQFFEDTADEAQVRTLYLMSNGQPGLMTSLLHNNDHYMYEYIDLAKTILKNNAYERLKTSEQLIKNKTDIPSLLYALIITTKGALHTSITNNQESYKSWQKIFKTVLRYSSFYQPAIQQKLFLSSLLLDL